MLTTILAYVIALVGLGTIAVGAWDLVILLTDTPIEEVSLSDLAIAVGIVSGGFGLIGLAQVLRLLTEILARGAKQGGGPQTLPSLLPTSSLDSRCGGFPAC
jgi:hypothetical protein